MHDQEGRAAKRRLLQTGEYAIRIMKLLGTEASLEAWIHYKITKSADYVSSVYHYMMGEKVLDQINETEEYIQMSASQLFKTAKYSAKLIRMIEDDQELKDWIQMKITKAASNLSDVYHYIDFEDASSMEAIEEGSRLPSSMIKSKEKMDWEAQHDVEGLRKRFQARADQYNANRKPEEHKTAKDMARSQELRIGREFAARAPYSRHVPESAVKEYTPFKNRVLSKLRGPVDLVKQRQDREAQADKKATLQNISKDRHTPYDQELKDKLAARLDKLRSTGL